MSDPRLAVRWEAFVIRLGTAVVGIGWIVIALVAPVSGPLGHVLVLACAAMATCFLWAALFGGNLDG